MLGNGPCGPGPVDTRCGGTGLAVPFRYIRGGGHSLCYYRNSTGLFISSNFPAVNAQTIAGIKTPCVSMWIIAF